MRGGKKVPLLGFFPVTPKNVGTSPKNFGLLFLTLATLLVRTKRYPQKNCFFWSNPYKTVFMITSLEEILTKLYQTLVT